MKQSKLQITYAVTRKKKSSFKKLYKIRIIIKKGAKKIKESESDCMPRAARKYLETSFFHVMVQGINKEYIFKNERYINRYLQLM